MAGTVEGGKRAAAANKARFGDDFYKVQGAKGGRARVPKGFGVNPELARIAGAKGGRISRRRKTKDVVKEQLQVHTIVNGDPEITRGSIDE